MHAQTEKKYRALVILLLFVSVVISVQLWNTTEEVRKVRAGLSFTKSELNHKQASINQRNDDLGKSMKKIRYLMKENQKLKGKLATRKKSLTQCKQKQSGIKMEEELSKIHKDSHPPVIQKPQINLPNQGSQQNQNSQSIRPNPVPNQGSEQNQNLQSILPNLVPYQGSEQNQNLQSILPNLVPYQGSEQNHNDNVQLQPENDDAGKELSNKKGVPTRRRRRGRWVKKTVKEMLPIRIPPLV